MILRDMIKRGQQKLEATTADAMIDARNFAQDLLDLDATGLFMAGDQDISGVLEEKYWTWIDRRMRGEPFQYIVGHQSFMGLDFLVEPGVLIPRSDTEILVESVLSKLQGRERVLDIGAGSGAIHCSLAHYKPGIRCTAVDISEIPLRVSKINAGRLGLLDQVTYVQSDLYQALQGQRFDVIVSNPPYIKKEIVETLQVELSYEPKLALDGGKDGYDFYRKIIGQAHLYFEDQGWLALEVGHDQSMGVKSLLEEAHYKAIEIIKDYSQIERVLLARYER